MSHTEDPRAAYQAPETPPSPPLVGEGAGGAKLSEGRRAQLANAVNAVERWKQRWLAKYGGPGKPTLEEQAIIDLWHAMTSAEADLKDARARLQEAEDAEAALAAALPDSIFPDRPLVERVKWIVKHYKIGVLAFKAYCEGKRKLKLVEADNASLRAKLAQEDEQERQLLQRDEELRKLRGEWVSLADEMPNTWTPVLVAAPAPSDSSYLITLRRTFLHEGGGVFGVHGHMECKRTDITHWRYLPAAPDLPRTLPVGGEADPFPCKLPPYEGGPLHNPGPANWKSPFHQDPGEDD